MKIRVRLTDDLTKYAEGLIPGIEGYSIGEKGLWSRNSDCFTTVLFDNGVELDVLWKGLDIIDEVYLKEQQDKKQRELDLLHTATNIEYTRGPNWGFRVLTFNIDGLGPIEGRKYIFDSKEADEYVKEFEKLGLEVNVITEKSAKQLQFEEELKNSNNITVVKTKRGRLVEFSYEITNKDGSIEKKVSKTNDTVRRRVELVKELGLELKEIVE